MEKRRPFMGQMPVVPAADPASYAEHCRNVAHILGAAGAAVLAKDRDPDTERAKEQQRNDNFILVGLMWAYARVAGFADEEG